MKSGLKWVIWLYIAAASAYIFYEWYAYAGVYRLAAEWQLENYGSYQVRLTLIVTILVLLSPAAVLVSLSGMQDQLRTAGSGAGSSAIFALLGGVVALAVAAGAGWYGYAKSMETFDIEGLDLSKGDTPRSTHVTITGIARTEYIVEFGTKSGSTTTLDRYIPLTPPTWRPGQPLVYFMKTNITAYMPPGGGMLMLSPRTPAFQMTTQPGVLVRDGLPGPVREHYRKNNLAVASPPIMLDLSSGADVKPFFVTAGVSGVLGFFMLVAAGAAALRQRRLAQS